MMYPALFVYASALATLAPLGTPQSQASIRVALVVTEKTGGLFESGFGQALRNLGDVAVVTPAERPDYQVQVVVLCDPDCDTAAQYAVSISVFQPLDSSRINSVFLMVRNLADTNRALYTANSRDEATLERALLFGLDGYKREVASIAALWGRAAYLRAIGEFVARLDTQCFEKDRLLSRYHQALARRDVTTSRALLTRWFNFEQEPGWTC